MTALDLAKYQPLLKEACSAFLEDANYAIAIAQAGTSLSAAKVKDAVQGGTPSDSPV